MLIKALIGLAFAALQLQFVSGETGEITEVLKIKNGKIRGILQPVYDNGHVVELYQGIPYGHANRFEKAQPASPWQGVYNATKMRAACPQFGSTFSHFWMNSTDSFSEDCLYLNVWRPATKKRKNTRNANRAVMVWIHGGAFEMGTIFISLTDARYMAHQGDVIVVSIQYRLGPLGFLTSPTIPPNLGLHDQILALKWIRENIHYFGGNPHSVTLFGQSAGSMSLGALILSPLTRGLFSRAIMQSGAPTAVHQFMDSPKKALSKTVRFAEKLNCTTVTLVRGHHHGRHHRNRALEQCIRSKSLVDLERASALDFLHNSLFLPTYDDTVLPFRPSLALKLGTHNRVDLMYGVTRDEGTLFAPAFFPEIVNKDVKLTGGMVREAIVKLMQHYSVADGNEVADFYLNKLPGNATQNDLRLAYSNVWGDLNLVCPTILFGQEFAKSAPHSDIYAYRLMQHFSTAHFPMVDPSWMGVTHGEDQFYLFQTKYARLNGSLYRLSTDMIRAWTTFAKSGKPSKMGGSVGWEGAFGGTVEHTTTRYMHLEDGHYKMVEGTHFAST